MSKFCRFCGARLARPDAAFCQGCGRPLGVGSEPLTSPMGATIEVQEPGQAPRTVHLGGASMMIGREPSSDLLMHHAVVSRQHARLELRGNDYWLSDLGSTNGTQVNGQRLQQSRPLRDGDIIRIGDQQGNSVSLVFHADMQPSGQTQQTYPSTIRLSELNLAQLQTYTIGRAQDNQLHLDHPTVSRHHAEVRETPQGAIIRDLGSQNGTYVNGRRVQGSARLQAGDVIQIGPFKVVYNAQMGTTLLNPEGNYRIDAVDLRRVVTIGSALSPAAWFGSNGQTTQRVILKDITLSVHPREFIALVGGSGAGKTTLMQALSGFTPADGRVYVNGDDLYANFGAYRSILGYVPQDDIIHGLLTVRTALTYAARLRLPDASLAEIEARIDRVLEQVEMIDHASKQINKLSGGQRKRVSIGVELLAEPGLFFLDEPTSGLDPGLEKKMMYTLRRLADDGRTVVLVTHATANITQCTHVAFLADGYLAFFGPPQEALTFFGADDFADIYTRLSQPIDPQRNPLPPQWQQDYRQLLAVSPHGPPSAAEVWTHCFHRSAQYQQYVQQRGPQGALDLPEVTTSAAQSKQRVSAWHQFRVLTRRYFDLTRRDVLNLSALMAVMPIIGIFLLIVAKQHDLVPQEMPDVRAEIQEAIDNVRAAQIPEVFDEQFSATYVVASAAERLLFMLALATNLLGIFAAAFELVKEEAVYRRERMVNLKILPYLLSKVAVLFGFAAVQVLLLLLVVGLKVEYPRDGVFMPAFLEMYITLLLATLASIGLGLFISAALSNQNAVIYVILVVLFVQILFAGTIFELPAVAEPVSYLTTSRWTLEALGTTTDMQTLNEAGVTCVEFESPEMRVMMGEAEPPCVRGQMRQDAPLTFSVTYERSEEALLYRWGILLLFTLVFGLGTFVLQKRKDVL